MILKDWLSYGLQFPKRKPDFWLIGIVISLGCIGVLMLYSASGQNFDIWARSHLEKMLFGVIVMLLLLMMRYDWWYKGSYIFYGVNLLMVAFVEFFGKVGMGAQRWIDLGFFQLQPSEIMKISLVLALSHYYCNRPLALIQSIQGQWVPAIMILVPAMLVLIQPNLGTALMLIGIGVGMMVVVGMRWWKFLSLLVIVLASMPVAWHMLHDYQKERVRIFLNPERDPLGSGYNIIQSKIALGSGGMWGKGYLQGTQAQLDFLPEKQTDFILAVVAEEFGFFGCFVVLLLFAALLGRMIWMAQQIEYAFGRYMLMGLAMNIFLYVLINVAMVTGLIPVVGIPLPLLSYGGTVMMAIFMAVGIAQNIWANRDHRMER